jgi:hypothetical protein
MEQKQSKVNHIAANGSWNSEKYGTFYRFEIGFENGDTGEYSSKSADQNKFVMGQMATYTITSKEHNGKTYHTIKPAEQPQQSGGGFAPRAKDPETEKRITRMSVLKCATDLVIHGKVELAALTNVAIILEHYVMTGDDSMAKIYAAHYEKQNPKPTNGIVQNFIDEAITEMTDDLPF